MSQPVISRCAVMSRVQTPPPPHPVGRVPSSVAERRVREHGQAVGLGGGPQQAAFTMVGMERDRGQRCHPL